MKIELNLMPKQLRILEALGQNIKLARLRRKLSSEQVAERAGIARMTLYKIEQGMPSVAMGAYVQVLFILGLHNDLAVIASNDVLGRKLQDAGLISKKRAPKK
jgi:transcriptional regulator with XRE-family HTH domain